MAKLSAAKIAANNRYNAKAYDRINIAIPKGQKAIYQELAQESSLSLNAWIVSTMEEKRAERTVTGIHVSEDLLDKYGEKPE